MNSLYIDDLILEALSVSFRIKRSIDQWKRLNSQSAPKSARHLAYLAEGIADNIENQANQYEKDSKNGSPPDLESCVALHKRADTVLTIGALLDQSTQHSLHPVLSPTVQSQLKSLSINGQVLVSGTRNMSYELMSLTRDIFSSLIKPETLDKIEWPLLIFLVPYTPLDWPLNHALIFHEIGHALYRGTKTNFESIIEANLPRVRTDKGIINHIKDANRKQLFKKVMTEWAEELYADAVGLLLLGPAYLSAFCRILGGFYSLDLASPSHPPSALRITLLRDLLEKYKLSNNIPNKAKMIIDSWIEEAQSIEKFRILKHHSIDPSDQLPVILSKIINKIIFIHSDIVTIVSKHLQNQCCNDESLKKHAARAELLYSYQIPNVETTPIPDLENPGEPLEPSAIFATYWSAFYLEFENRQDNNEFIKKIDDQGDVMLGALDAAEALRTWLRVKK